MLKAPEGLRCKEQTEPHNTVKHRRNADSVGWTTRVNFDFVPNINHVDTGKWRESYLYYVLTHINISKEEKQAIPKACERTQARDEIPTAYLPQHFLYYFPLPHGQSSFLPIFLPTCFLIQYFRVLSNAGMNPAAYALSSSDRLSSLYSLIHSDLTFPSEALISRRTMFGAASCIKTAKHFPLQISSSFGILSRLTKIHSGTSAAS